MLSIIGLSLIPFIQLGYSYWISTSTLSTLFTIANFKLKNLIDSSIYRNPNTYIYLFVLIFGLGAYLDMGSDDLSHDLLITGRIILFWVIMAFFLDITSKRIHLINAIDRRVPYFIMLLTLLMLMVVCLQSTPSGLKTFVLPKEWFAQNADTIPDELDLIFSKIRPMGTFGEPSYLAFFCISVLVMCIPFLNIKKYKWISYISIIALLITGILSQSMSFLISAIILLSVSLIKLDSLKKLPLRYNYNFYIYLIFTALSVITLILYSLIISNDRISVITSGEDLSANIRIFGPIISLMEYLPDHPIGLPSSRITEVYPEYLRKSEVKIIGEPKIDNAALFILYFFGYVGFLVLYTILKSSYDRVVLFYLLICLNFNGSIFTPDKFSIIITTVLSYVYFKEACKNAKKTVKTPVIRNGFRAFTY